MTVLGLSWYLCCIVRDLFLAVHKFSICYTGSRARVGVTHGLSCSTAWEILFTQPGIKPTSPTLQGILFIIGLPGKSSKREFCNMWIIYILKKNQLTFVIKPQRKLNTEGNFLNLIENFYKNSIANFRVNVRD